MRKTGEAEAALLRQQDVLAKFGELALRCDDLDEILTEACRLVGDALGTDLAKVMEMQADGVTLRVRAGVGWKPGVVGRTTVKAEEGSSEGYALRTGQPVASSDIDTETRFKYADFLKDNGVRALVNVAIGGGACAPFGILQVDSRVPREFGVRETNFLRGYANLLAAAVDRLETNVRLRTTQEALRARDASLVQSNKLEAIGQLTGGVAHDFNNLLTIIRSSTDFLRRDDLPNHRRTRYVEAISETVDRASKLTGQLLAFARRQALNPEAFDVGLQVKSVSDLLASLLGGRIIIVQDGFEPSSFANADISQFETALVNLAVNARDAMNGEGTITFKVWRTTSIPKVRGHEAVEGDFVAISVVDSGVGIEKDNIAKIFEPFYTTKDVGKGTGLGLSQVYGFAKQSTGEVGVESVLGTGSTFTLYLPHVITPELNLVRSEEPVTKKFVGAGVRVLVVEDNEAVGLFASEMLGDLGCQTVWVLNAEDALIVLAAEGGSIGLVFSDVIMPGRNGLELADEIRRLYPALPVLLTSGYSNVLAGEGSHGFALLHKPYSVQSLSQMLQKAFRRDVGETDP